jgi:hypothetical protein
MADRMRIECGDNRWAALRLGKRDCFARNRLMPGMKTVKIAQRDYGSAQRIWHGVAVGQARDH